MKKPYEFLEHTADSKFKAYGETIEEAFENSAKATFDTMIDISTVKQKSKKKIELETENIEELLYKWISELIYLFSAKNIVFSNFNVDITKDKLKYKLMGEAIGEKIDLSKHVFNTEVKAITYHNLEIKKNEKYQIITLLDT
ncbi:archease [archaeon SCG-AAA382B04]|nr:archease [archaeon SCG-AAA382B04]